MTYFLVKLTNDYNGRLNQFAQEMLAKGCMTDCVLRSLCENDESEDIKCHSFVLGAYSPYFYRCLSGGSVKLIVLDVRGTIIQHIVKLIYFGQCTVLEYDIIDLENLLRKLKIDHTAPANIHHETKNNNQLKRRLTTEPAGFNDLLPDGLADLNDDKKHKPPFVLQSNDNQSEIVETSDQTEEARYSCPICFKVYQYDISLNKHIKTAHRTPQ